MLSNIADKIALDKMIDFVKKKVYTKNDFLIQNDSDKIEPKDDIGIETAENETPDTGPADISDKSSEKSVNFEDPKKSETRENSENPENSQNPETSENSENTENFEDQDSNIEPFGFEVLKNGQSCGKITFDKLELKLGRTPENDIECLHPSTSRHHATIIIKESGVFIRDEGSTHGTFLNKKPLQGKVETQIKVGHFLKFGLSTRSFILTGPDSEREAEMKATWNELKLHKERTNRAKKMTKQQLEAFMSGEDVNSVEKKAKEEKDTEMKSKLHEVTWGFGEDTEKSDKSSDEDEGEGMELGKNEDLKKAYYVTDPVKALNHFFAKEMQGATPTDMEKIGKNRWRVKILLPIDSEKTGKQLTAVAEGTPQSEAIREASLDACRMLDKAGVLRSDASTKKFITRDWKTNDYYDSDEDEFLDRTDQLQKKREMRKQKLGEIDPEFRKTLSKSYRVVL